MKKAIQVMATLVAFLLSGQAFAITVYPTMPPIKDVVGGTATKLADGVKFSGNIFAREFIPNPINKALAVLPETTIASTAISGLAKKLVVGGVAGIAAGYAFDQMINGVGWLIESGSVVKMVNGADPLTGITFGGNLTDLRCATMTSYGVFNAVSSTGVSSGATYVVSSSPYTSNGYVFASNCSPYYGSYKTGHIDPATISTTKVPVTVTDTSVLDGFVKNKDGTWQRDLTTQMCGGLESCYQALSPSTVLTGPTTISGSPQTVTTTAPDGSVSTTVKTPSTTVSYGPNWYDYNPVTTTTTTNNGGTTRTTDNAPDTFPNVPDMLGGGNDGLKGIKDGISGTTSSTSPIPYMAWYSFSQQCSEITLTIPVYGPFSTAICPVYATYIWPTLYFFFAVFTWIRCWGIWRDTVLRVRAS
jgi:hypothetical protein